jgi:hypothetical protein
MNRRDLTTAALLSLLLVSAAGAAPPALLFAGVAYDEPKYLETWRALEASPTNEEAIRNLPIRQPVLWLD